VGTSNGIALALSNMQSNIFATSNKHGIRKQKYRPPPRSRNLSLRARAGRDDGRRSPASAAFACGALTVIGLIALFLYRFIRSVLLTPLAIAGLAARKLSCDGFLRPHQC